MYPPPLPVHEFSIPDAWFALLRGVMEYGREYEITQGSYVGTRRKELGFVVCRIENPGFRPFVPVIPPHIDVPVPTTVEYVEEYYHSYLMNTDIGPNEEYTYGSFIQPQILPLLEKYENGPNTNQACMTIGDIESIKSDDPPCLRLIDTRIQDGKLHFIVYFRSWELWSAFPTNLAAIQLLKEDMAKYLNVEDGTMLALSKGLHLYEYAWDYAATRLIYE